MLYLSDYRLGNMVLFSLIFVVTFILVAKYHHHQLTIILVACSISLLLAFVLLPKSFQWNRVVNHYMEWEVLAVVFGMSILVEATVETGLFDWLIIRMLKI